MAKALLLFSALTACISVVMSQCFPKDDTRLKDRDIDLAAQHLVEGSTRFSLTLLKTLNDAESSNIDSKGIFFSPYSIWSALLITYMGSRGVTEQEMRNVLGINDIDKVTTWESIRNIHSFIPYALNNSRELSYTAANRIYFQEGTTFKDCVQEQLNNDIAFVDFLNNPDSTREIINSWVENKTQNRIKDFIPLGGINSLTNMLIASAVYFNKAWVHPFETKARPYTFMPSTGKNISVTMMYRRAKFRYVRDEDLQCSALEIPYVGGAVSMLILLPENFYDGVDVLANQLTPERLRNLLDGMHVREMTAMIPKFKFESSYELSSVLSKMGLRSLFDRRRVDLSGFTGRREFTVDSAHHKTFIDVNEKGTEAAAATRFMSSKKSRLFVADHPFVYIIRDNLSGVILFLGTVQNPQEFGSS